MGKCNQPCRNTWNSPSITFKFEIKKGFKKCLTLWVFQYFWWKQVSEHQLILHYYHHLRLWSYQNHFFVIWSLCNTKMTLCQILKLGTLFFRLELKGFCINFFSQASPVSVGLLNLSTSHAYIPSVSSFTRQSFPGFHNSYSFSV